MTQAILRIQTPEEREYARYLNEIDIRKQRVAELQTQLELLHEELGRFNAEYHARIGTLFITLDKLDLASAEYKFRIARLSTASALNADELEHATHSHFSGQREEVHQNEEETQRYQRAYSDDRRRPELDEGSAATLKAVYRELVKRFHPDLARTELERLQREAVMKRINAAFHERDVVQLQSIINEAEIEDPSFEFRSMPNKLIWAIREISRLDEAIVDINTVFGELKVSDLAVLWTRHQSGEGVLEQLEHNLSQRIENGRQILQSLINDFLAHAAHMNDGD